MKTSTSIEWYLSKGYYMKALSRDGQLPEELPNKAQEPRYMSLTQRRPMYEMPDSEKKMIQAWESTVRTHREQQK